MTKKIMPIITAEALEADITIAETYLETLIAENSEVSKKAFGVRFGKKSGDKEQIDFRSMMRIARRYAYQLDDTCAAEYEPIEEALSEAMYDYPTDDEMVGQGLYDNRFAPPVMVVGFTALARSNIMRTPDGVTTSFRYPQYLARMYTDECLEDLEAYGVSVFPYAYSSGEFDDHSDYVYFGGELAEGKILDWVVNTPGYIPNRATSDEMAARQRAEILALI